MPTELATGTGSQAGFVTSLTSLGASRKLTNGNLEIEFDSHHLITTPTVLSLVGDGCTIEGLKTYIVLNPAKLDNNARAAWNDSRNEDQSLKKISEWSQSSEPVGNNDDSLCFIFAFSGEKMDTGENFKLVHDNLPDGILHKTECELKAMLQGEGWA